MDNLKDKIKSILQSKFPDMSPEEIDELMADYGEIVVMRTLNQTYDMLDSEESRQAVASYFSRGLVDQAFEYAEERGVDMNEIFEECSKDIVLEIFETVEE